MFPAYRTLRCSLLLVLLSMMGASWILENPGRSTILLHPWLQWAIQTIKKVSGTDTSLKVVGPWNLTWGMSGMPLFYSNLFNSSLKFQGPFLEKKVTKFKMLLLDFGWLLQPLGLKSLVKQQKLIKFRRFLGHGWETQGLSDLFLHAALRCCLRETHHGAYQQ